MMRAHRKCVLSLNDSPEPLRALPLPVLCGPGARVWHSQLLAGSDSPAITLPPSEPAAPSDTHTRFHLWIIPPVTHTLDTPFLGNSDQSSGCPPLQVAFLVYPVRTRTLPHLCQPRRHSSQKLHFSDPCKHKHVGFGQSRDLLLPRKAGWERPCKAQTLILLGSCKSSSTRAQLSRPACSSSHLVVVTVN